SAPKLGDRVPYVIICGTKKTPAYDRAEDPLYVMDHSIPIDKEYYLQNQLAKPLLRIFEPIYGEAKAKSMLLHGEHTRTKTVVSTNYGIMGKFLQKGNRCMNCKVVLKTKQQALCDNEKCKAAEAEIYYNEIEHWRRYLTNYGHNVKDVQIVYTSQ
ncbi:DNA polymerase delta catalytic subunit-like protein, partial [Leptotrombidium deliense]